MVSRSDPLTHHQTEWARHWYDEGLSLRSIGQLLNRGWPTIRAALTDAQRADLDKKRAANRAKQRCDVSAAEILAKRRQGATMDELAHRYGCSRIRLYRILKRSKLDQT